MAGQPDNTPPEARRTASAPTPAAASPQPAADDTPSSPLEAAPEMVNCALTGKLIRADEAYWGPPLVTFEELIGTTFKTLFTAPGNLKAVMTAEQDDVPYDPAAKPQLIRRRTREKSKLLLMMLVILALLIWLLLSVGGSLV